MKLFKKLGLFVVTGAMALGIGLSLGASTINETKADEVVYYTANYSAGSYIASGSLSSTYPDTDTYSLTDGTVTKGWTSYGTNPNSYAVAGTRFGGKNTGDLASALANAPVGITTGTGWYYMTAATSATMGQAITKVTVESIGTFGTGTFVTGKKMFLQVSANSDFSSSTDYSTTIAATATHTFTAATEWDAASYYRVVMERNSTSSTNSGLIVANIKFYANLSVVDVASVAINQPETTSLNIGETLELSATVLPANATDKSLTWSSDDPSVLEVDQNGKVIAISNGSAVITATSSQKPSVFDYIELEVVGTPSSYDKTFTATDFGMLSTYVDGNYSDDGIVYYAYQVMKSVNSTTMNALQFRGNPSGYLYNKTAYESNISKITIKLSFGNTVDTYAIYVGSVANPDSTITVTGVADPNNAFYVTFDVAALGNFKYFKITRTSTSGTVYIDGISVQMVNTDVEAARTYASSFLSTLDAECAALNVSSSTWSTLSSSYSALSAAAKVAYTGETATVVVTDIQKALERYVYIVNKYGYTNFMGITIEGASSTSLDISRSNSVSTIVLIAVAGFTAIGGMFFLKRKREE